MYKKTIKSLHLHLQKSNYPILELSILEPTHWICHYLPNGPWRYISNFLPSKSPNFSIR